MTEPEPITLVDSNVLLDLGTTNTAWRDWAELEVAHALRRGEIAINPLILAELAPAFSSAGSLDAAFPESVVLRLQLPYEAAWPAGQAFLRYRRAGGVRRSPLPDFYIGAHAQVSDMTLLTRDAGRYRTYFPDVRLIAPDA